MIKKIKFKDIGEMTEQSLINERDKVKLIIKKNDLTNDFYMKYFYRLCDLNHKIKLFELGIFNKTGINIFSRVRK